MGRYSKIVKKKKKRSVPLLSEIMQAFVARRLIDATALILVLGGVALLLAMASYSHTDPSWNTAGAAKPAQIENLLNVPGSYISDFFLQTIGLGGAVLAVILSLWGIRIGLRHPLTPLWKRFSSAIISILLASIAFARLPAGPWLLHPYWGGSGGTLMLNKITGLFAPYISENGNTIIVPVISGFLAFAFLSYAAALSKTEWGFFFKTMRTLITESVYITFYMLRSFYNWLRHYGDPAYEAPRLRKRAPEISTPAKKEKDQCSAAVPEQRAGGLQAPIRVINPKKEMQKKGTDDFAADNVEWELPPSSLLQEVPAEVIEEQLDKEALRKNAKRLQNVLSDFNISGEIVSIHPGPVVTLYELEPSPGTKTSRVIGLADDIARSMSVISVRCAVIPGRNVIGIEMPNDQRQTVYLRDLLETKEVLKTKAHLPLVLGKDIGGQPIIADLAKMPHLLIAGTTGAGKSVAINTMILSLVYNLPPEKCRLIMIDPKMLELSAYDDIPHLLSPVVTEPGKAIIALKWAVQEMENRYRSMSRLGVRNIEGYNTRLAEAHKKGETLMRKVQTGFDSESGKPVFEDQTMDMTELPYIVVIVDEFADLMLVAGKDVEGAIQRLAQMARAAGIHLIMATQRPSVDVITGVIKANFPTRISFQVTSKVDSRTILGEGGAEQLLGMGDMLYMAAGGRINRVHGPFASDEDVENVVNFLKDQGQPHYLGDITEEGDFGDSDVMSALFGEGEDSSNAVDELYDKAVALVAKERKASTSFIQRYLQIGYNRAARIIEEMERQGIVTPATATGKREVLVGDFSDA